MVGLGQRIVFVVVAAAARHRQAQQRAAGGLDEVGHEFGTATVLLVERRCGVVVRSEPEKAGGDEAIAVGRRGRSATEQFVTRQLFADELVQWLVGVERSDDVVAVAPRLGAELVPVETVAVAVAHRVEPQARPVFTETRRGQETFHQAIHRRATSVPLELRDLFRRRRQPRQVEVEAPHQGPAIRLRHGLGLGCLEAREREAIDIRSAPGSLLDLGKRWIRHRFERPEIEALTAEDLDDRIAGIGPGVADARSVGRNSNGGGSGRVVGPREPVPDPSFQNRDVPRRELLLGRHREVLVRMHHRRDQKRLGRLSQDRRRTGVSAFENGRAGV